MSHEAVRPAGSGDLDRVAALLGQLRQEAGESRGGTLLLALGDPWGGRPPDAGPDPADLAAWLDHPQRRLVVGEFDGAVVGVAAGTVRGGPPPVGRIECCYVESSARQVGVGAALVADLVSWATGHGCAHLEAAALPGDRQTKQLYETAGFKARLLLMHRAL